MTEKYKLEEFCIAQERPIPAKMEPEQRKKLEAWRAANP